MVNGELYIDIKMGDEWSRITNIPLGSKVGDRFELIWHRHPGDFEFRAMD